MDGLFRVDPLSFCVAKLELTFNEITAALGTCFFWSKNSSIYLVTAWHNFSGRNPITGRHLSPKTLIEPNHCEFNLFIGGGTLERRLCKTPIRDSASNQPLWLIHPNYKRSIDIAVLPIYGLDSVLVRPINQEKLVDLSLRVTEDAYVLGYPHGVDVYLTPIWKRASVASEPQLPVEGLPLSYIDSPSTKWMSGSPVVAVRVSQFSDDRSRLVERNVQKSFVGVYSGRLGEYNAFRSRLGRVWHKRCIDVADEAADGVFLSASFSAARRRWR